MGHLAYFAILAACLIGTAPLEIVLRTRVYARWRRLVLALVPTVVVFVAWDVWAIAAGHWTYNERFVTGLSLGDMPVEEFCFFLVIPTCAILTLEAVRARKPEWLVGDEEPEVRAKRAPKRERLRDERLREEQASTVTYTWLALLGVLGAVGVDLGVLRTELLRRRVFWTAYAIILFFQLIVNGLLTGLPIVTYDEDVITGLRIANAPVEDLLFGFAMVVLTLSTWVWLGRRSKPAAP